jgi:hypothetical protein
MSSDGNKSVNITAQGAKADELLQMLKMAGMRPHDDHDHSTMSEPEIIMIGNDEMMEQELEEAKRRTTRYSNTPDEEYQSVKSITDQGADLNRQKRQYAGKPRLGDNPMAESALDYDLNEILESILIRDDQDRPEIKKDPETGRVSATYPAPKKPDQSQLPLPSERESRVSGPRTFKVDGERTGTEDYKQDDESEIYEEEPKTWLQRQPDRLPGEKSWDERVKDSDPNYVIPAERPYKDEKGRTVTPPRGATNPPADSPYPPGDRRNMQPSKRK